MTDSLCEMAREATNWFDSEIGQLLGVSAPAVQAWRRGRNPERMTAAQRETLLKALQQWRDHVNDIVDKVEMLS